MPAVTASEVLHSATYLFFFFKVAGTLLQAQLLKRKINPPLDSCTKNAIVNEGIIDGIYLSEGDIAGREKKKAGYKMVVGFFFGLVEGCVMTSNFQRY